MVAPRSAQLVVELPATHRIVDESQQPPWQGELALHMVEQVPLTHASPSGQSAAAPQPHLNTPANGFSQTAPFGELAQSTQPPPGMPHELLPMAAHCPVRSQQKPFA